MFVGFIAFTWNQYTEFVTEHYINYIALYGNLSWMAAVVGVLAGFIVDWVSTKLPYPVFESKVLVVLCLAIGMFFFSLFLNQVQSIISLALGYTLVNLSKWNGQLVQRYLYSSLIEH